VLFGVSMTKRNKEKVYESYEEIVDWFDDARTKTLMESEYLNLIINSVPADGSVLDLGCGTGEPIAQFFIDKGFKVTGVDGSKKMIELCKKRFPSERWMILDMCNINLNQKFDVVLAWHSFFHLDQDSQRKMFKVFNTHTKPNGILAFTSGEKEGEVWSDNGGQMLYHASLSTKEYEKLLNENSFKVLLHKIRDPECGEATVWVAQKV
jgi:SAM-dependent methyltransferase